MYCFRYNLGKLWGNIGYIQNVPSFPVFQTFPCSVPRFSPDYTESGTLWLEGSGHSKCATRVYFGYTVLAHFEFYWLRTPWSHHSENRKKSLNKPIGNITVAFCGKIQDVPINFPMGTSRSHDLEHCNHTTGNTARTFWMSHLVHCSYFLWEIQDVPINYLMGTLQSHDPGHCECPDHFLGWENCMEIGRENSECTWDVPSG